MMRTIGGAHMLAWRCTTYSKTCPGVTHGGQSGREESLCACEASVLFAAKEHRFQEQQLNQR